MWKYVGSSFINGIPSRDISEEEINNLTKAEQDAIKNSGLYKQEKSEKKSVKSAQEE